VLSPPRLPTPGTLISGKFEVTDHIGSGGMASVYVATDQTLGRQVAIKVLDPRLMSDPDNLRRFEHEARVARHLEHPNTIQIFDFGTLDDGLPFIVMEYLRGRPLDEIIQAEGALHPDRVMHIAKQVLWSLQNAHANRVLHRDLKPRNVIVGEFGGQSDFAKVLDFGLAKVLDLDREASSLATRSGLMIGTPEYIPPERLRGEELGPSSDLFSFGLMMIEMLCGRSPYAGLAPLQVLSNIIDDAPVPMPDAVRQGWLGAVVIKAAEKQLERRYQSADAILADLETLGMVADEATVRPADGRALKELIARQLDAAQDIPTEQVARQPVLDSPAASSTGPAHMTETLQMSPLPDGLRPSAPKQGMNALIAVLVVCLVGVTAVIVMILLGR